MKINWGFEQQQCLINGEKVKKKKVKKFILRALQFSTRLLSLYSCSEITLNTTHELLGEFCIKALFVEYQKYYAKYLHR